MLCLVHMQYLSCMASRRVHPGATPKKHFNSPPNAFSGRAVHDLARIHEPVRIQSALDALHYIDCLETQLFQQ